MKPADCSRVLRIDSTAVSDPLLLVSISTLRPIADWQANNVTSSPMTTANPRRLIKMTLSLDRSRLPLKPKKLLGYNNLGLSGDRSLMLGLGPGRRPQEGCRL